MTVQGGERKLIGGHKADVRPCAARGEPGRQQVRVTDQGDGQGREGGRDAEAHRHGRGQALEGTATRTLGRTLVAGRPAVGAAPRPPVLQRRLDRPASTSAAAAKTPPSANPTVRPGCMAAVVASAVSPG